MNEDKLNNLKLKIKEYKTTYDLCDDCLLNVIFSPSDRFIKQHVYCMHRRNEMKNLKKKDLMKKRTPKSFK